MGNGPEYLMMGCVSSWIYNGQFELGPDDVPVGWEVYPYASGVIYRTTGGKAGNWCIRGGQSGTGTGGHILQAAFMPVDEDRDYNMHITCRGQDANSTFSFGCACYDAAKAYISNVAVRSAVAPTTSWARYNDVIGPSGTAWAQDTHYARIYVILSASSGANRWIWADDVYFRPEP